MSSPPEASQADPVGTRGSQVNYAAVRDLWAWLLPGYLLTIAIETPVLLVFLSPPHRWTRRIAAGAWLTACTYPVVVIAMPVLLGMEPRWRYLAVAETFAPVAECVLFTLAFQSAELRTRDRLRDWAAITVANLSSFILGEWCWNRGWLTWLS